MHQNQAQGQPAKQDYQQHSGGQVGEARRPVLAGAEETLWTGDPFLGEARARDWPVLPLGGLKRNDAALPQAIPNAIQPTLEALGTGLIELVQFSEKFWVRRLMAVG
jgi:hypothetical protein